jgi:hypothetical protein
MLGVEHTKMLLANLDISDREAREIRDIAYMLAEIIFDKWRTEQLSAHNEEDGQADSPNV